MTVFENPQTLVCLGAEAFYISQTAQQSKQSRSGPTDTRLRAQTQRRSGWGTYSYSPLNFQPNTEWPDHSQPTKLITNNKKMTITVGFW